MKKVFLVLSVTALTIGVSAQGIIGLGYTKQGINNCSHSTVCSSSGYRIRPLNNSVEGEKSALIADMAKSHPECTNIEFQQFVHGDVVAIYIITVEDGNCTWSKFILGIGKTEDGADADAQKKIDANPEKLKNNLGRVETMSF